MGWASVSTTVLPLAGVVIGACGTLLGQRMALQIDARREAARRAADQRGERKDAIIGFLSATERIEQYRGQHLTDGVPTDDQLIELLHAVWLAKKIIELVCSGALAQAAQHYTEELDRASHGAASTGPGQQAVAVSDRARLFRRNFMEAARREMGYAGDPLLRRAGTEGTAPEGNAPEQLHAAGR
jgi:hypothetical protein